LINKDLLEIIILDMNITQVNMNLISYRTYYNLV